MKILNELLGCIGILLGIYCFLKTCKYFGERGVKTFLNLSDLDDNNWSRHHTPTKMEEIRKIRPFFNPDSTPFQRHVKQYVFRYMVFLTVMLMFISLVFYQIK